MASDYLLHHIYPFRISDAYVEDYAASVRISRPNPLLGTRSWALRDSRE